MTRNFLAASLLASMIGSAQAQTIISFHDVDVSGDARISAAEIVNAQIRLDEFRKADLNGDGYLSDDEFQQINLTKYEMRTEAPKR